jgi:hypothetical protein
MTGAKGENQCILGLSSTLVINRPSYESLWHQTKSSTWITRLVKHNLRTQATAVRYASRYDASCGCESRCPRLRSDLAFFRFSNSALELLGLSVLLCSPVVVPPLTEISA